MNFTGYVRFLNERREQVRAANPSAGFADIMKIMAQEWTQLPAEEKQKYMQAAEQDRQRYQKELQEYQQTEAYKSYVQQQQQQHVQQQLHLQQQQRQAMQATHQSQSQVISGFLLPIYCYFYQKYSLMCSNNRRHIHLTAKSRLSHTSNKSRVTTPSCILSNICSQGNINSMAIEVTMPLVTVLMGQEIKSVCSTFPSSRKNFSITTKVRLF